MGMMLKCPHTFGGNGWLRKKIPQLRVSVMHWICTWLEEASGSECWLRLSPLRMQGRPGDASSGTSARWWMAWKEPKEGTDIQSTSNPFSSLILFFFFYSRVALRVTARPRDWTQCEAKLRLSCRERERDTHTCTRRLTISLHMENSTLKSVSRAQTQSSVPLSPWQKEEKKREHVNYLSHANAT